ncbi:hypothetical protein EMIHUDRAFT_197694 [Emiliania huxleyi CCMP1516]|uniref:Uncharacterized protein n=2 Tax=Emiliania huxleyi TaxID=2903 RepID=A0A0D3IDK7_EMIH1|nr:hypothetical protein EMIHUDRAFT_197694 [Emiliania huxleyi CCMP1516]EOD09342.1 hypothetical protein EMIHUDRAFT_197694 [Emiliania huxleyi CCMP1516]|eukprot:XP_005761771.1 hypothetical protein EMIHUDRAFT_197694 [Emiliania huxleyi CCMP1516]
MRIAAVGGQEKQQAAVTAVIKAVIEVLRDAGDVSDPPGNAVLKRVLPEALDETKVTTPRALAEYLRLPEVSCAPRVPSAEQRRQMRELVEGDADRAEREKVEPLQHRRREAHELPLPGQQRGQLITRWRAADGAGSIADRMSCTRRADRHPQRWQPPLPKTT